MPTPEDVLYEKTSKDGVTDVDCRVFYTLLDQDSKFDGNRTNKLLARIVAHLLKTNVLSEKELDEMLFKIIQ